MLSLDHIQLAIPPGSEEPCRVYYRDLLGMTELTKPPVLAARGGLWLRGGSVEIHLGVEKDFRPARKAHPAILVGDLDGLAKRLQAAGHEVAFDDIIAGTRRFFTHDPLGNRLEFIAAKGE